MTFAETSAEALSCSRLDRRQHLVRVEHRRPCAGVATRRSPPCPFQPPDRASPDRARRSRDHTLTDRRLRSPLHRLRAHRPKPPHPLLASTPGALASRRAGARLAPTAAGTPFDGPDATGPVCSALGVSLPLDGFLRVKVSGLVASRFRSWGSSRFPRRATWSEDLAHTGVSRLAGSHPPKDSTRLQPHRVTAAVALLPFRPDARSSLRAPDLRGGAGLRLPSTANRCRFSISRRFNRRRRLQGLAPRAAATEAACHPLGSRSPRAGESVAPSHRFRPPDALSIHGLCSSSRLAPARASRPASPVAGRPPLRFHSLESAPPKRPPGRRPEEPSSSHIPLRRSMARYPFRM